MISIACSQKVSSFSRRGMPQAARCFNPLAAFVRCHVESRTRVTTKYYCKLFFLVLKRRICSKNWHRRGSGMGTFAPLQMGIGGCSNKEYQADILTDVMESILYIDLDKAVGCTIKVHETVGQSGLNIGPRGKRGYYVTEATKRTSS